MPDNASQIFAPKSVTAQPLNAAAALSDPFYWSSHTRNQVSQSPSPPQSGESIAPPANL